jgi:mannitol/fructose-specific phosphotransferase system IIA component (Ntr-type)
MSKWQIYFKIIDGGDEIEIDLYAIGNTKDEAIKNASMLIKENFSNEYKLINALQRREKSMPYKKLVGKDDN